MKIRIDMSAPIRRTIERTVDSATVDGYGTLLLSQRDHARGVSLLSGAFATGTWHTWEVLEEGDL